MDACSVTVHELLQLCLFMKNIMELFSFENTSLDILKCWKIFEFKLGALGRFGS